MNSEMNQELLNKLSELEAVNAELKEGQNEIKTMIKGVKQELRGLIEIQKRLIHERLGVPNPPASTEYAQPEGKKIKNIEIKNYTDGRISIAGNTFDYNSAIKAAATDNGQRARWEPAPHKLWHMPEDCLDSLVENLRNLDLEEGKDFSVDVKRSEAKAEASDEFGSGFD